MLKYVETMIGFSEVPEEITLCINISGCPNHCKGCHSPHLWKDIGETLDTTALSNLISKNKGITCVAFMGGDNSLIDILYLSKWVRDNTDLKVCWYSGRTSISSPTLSDLHEYMDFIKLGPYIEELGGLDSPTTNQRLFKVEHGENYVYLKDITYKFRNNETDNKNKSAD